MLALIGGTAGMWSVLVGNNPTLLTQHRGHSQSGFGPGIGQFCAIRICYVRALLEKSAVSGIELSHG